jgi:hypothetical protein
LKHSVRLFFYAFPQAARRRGIFSSLLLFFSIRLA